MNIFVLIANLSPKLAMFVGQLNVSRVVLGVFARSDFKQNCVKHFRTWSGLALSKLRSKDSKAQEGNATLVVRKVLT